MKRETTIGFQVRSLSNLFRRSVDTEIERQDEEFPTGVQSWILGYLCDHDGASIYQGELEEKFEVRRSTMTEMLNAMEKNGLIYRVRDESDGRKKQIFVTNRAKALHAKVVSVIEGVNTAAAAGLTAEEQQTFFALMARVKSNLENRLQERGGHEHE